MEFKSKAIVLKRIAFGEADLVVTLFSEKSGRISAIARSARKSQKRFVGAFETGTLLEVGIKKGRGQLFQIDDAFVLKPINGALKSLERIDRLTSTIELAQVFLQEHEVSAAKFELLKNRIQAICDGHVSYIEKILFELKWLGLCGFAPKLDGCVMCNTHIDDENKIKQWTFDHDQGGLVCKTCDGTRAAARRVKLEKGTFDGILQMQREHNLGEEEAVQINAVFRNYIQYIIGKPLKGGEILNPKL